MSDLTAPSDAVFSEFCDDFAGEVCDGGLHQGEPGLGCTCVFTAHDYCVFSVWGVQLQLSETQGKEKTRSANLTFVVNYHKSII